jgi:hypothetical protein
MDAEFGNVRSFYTGNRKRKHSLENLIWKSLWSGEKTG